MKNFTFPELLTQIQETFEKIKPQGISPQKEYKKNVLFASIATKTDVPARRALMAYWAAVNLPKHDHYFCKEIDDALRTQNLQDKSWQKQFPERFFELELKDFLRRNSSRTGYSGFPENSKASNTDKQDRF